MRRMTDDSRWALLNAYADGTCTPEERASAERLLDSDPSAQRELATVRTLKHAAAARTRIEPHPRLWDAVARGIEAQGTTTPGTAAPMLPRRVRPAAAAISALCLIALVVIGVLERGPISRFVSRKSGEVQLAYEQNVKGWIMPLFAKTSNDQVLQFAIFGTLPLDESSSSVLRVDSTAQHGYRIEVARKTAVPSKSVTVEDLYREVRATADQRRVMDTLFAYAQKQIERSVLISDEQGIAIDPRLAGFDKTILTSVASSLETPQRVRLARFLDERGLPHASIAVEIPSPPSSPERVLSRLRPVAEPSQFVVVSGDRAARVRRVLLDPDSIRDVMIRMLLPAAEIAERVGTATRRITADYMLAKEQQNFAREMQRAGEQLHEELRRNGDINVSLGDLEVSGDSHMVTIRLGSASPQPPAPPMIMRRVTGMQAPPMPPDRQMTSGRPSMPGRPPQQFRVRVLEGSESPVDINIDSVLEDAFRHIPGMRPDANADTGLNDGGVSDAKLDSLRALEYKIRVKVNESVQRALRDRGMHVRPAPAPRGTIKPLPPMPIPKVKSVIIDTI